MSRAWIVAARIGAVEALKDQGICRWNYTIRSLHQHARTNIRSFARHSNILSSPASYKLVNNKSEENMRKVMDLSCFGPNTTRF
ncbi:hypothetical protein ERO13_A01G069300v2 [Gossypium hirsutum]|uniref:Wound-responsive family protein n=4 Tax=Gossypium TaxID=3633 RepID=A0A5J5WTL5_GOSBA|nr:hypothetical protein ES319_A01G069800v1 [Gossypium barbadense]KAG4213650.1 hypothetical protein ERO13_A01G069300v2 [Gossypium hirsutum]TYH30218.1 hypothetical protein ES288_A01G076900v1 [Gossypium darwinii]TYI42224.1 hypothetical protein ES332_A01G083100v1 [Gossypium tomentosum]TYJ48568.1 hypothetical protein E1A91_A01G071800v1 [Gossypium mustelinum]